VCVCGGGGVDMKGSRPQDDKRLIPSLHISLSLSTNEIYFDFLLNVIPFALLLLLL